MDLFSAKCSSVWLTIYPSMQDFHLKDFEMPCLFIMVGSYLAIYISYVTDHCDCGSSFSPDHAIICQHGGLTFVCHNELCDLTNSLVAVDPPL